MEKETKVQKESLATSIYNKLNTLTLIIEEIRSVTNFIHSETVGEGGIIEEAKEAYQDESQGFIKNVNYNLSNRISELRFIRSVVNEIAE